MRVLASFLLGFLLSFGFARTQIWKNEVLGESEQVLEITPASTNTPTQTPTPSPTLIPTKKSTPTPLPSPTPLPQILPEQIHSFIERFSAQYGVDPNVLRHIAVCESGFNPLGVNGPYVGLFQFADKTWKSNRKIMGEDENSDLRFDAEESTQTAAYLISIGKGAIWPNCYPFK